MLKIFQVQSTEDKAQIRKLFGEYLHWVNAKGNELYGITMDVEAMVEQDMVGLEKFLPPYGRLLLAEQDSQIVGLACMKQLRADLGEIKRMYVRPELRGQGIGAQRGFEG